MYILKGNITHDDHLHPERMSNNREIIVNQKNRGLFSPGGINSLKNIIHKIPEGAPTMKSHTFQEIEEHYHLNSRVQEYGKLLEICI
ncbi:hypothetical protein [Ascidiimonas aurantiaca]|uniref:hypothetical protein n=1 Tax=Ascidiimonas aurantiaca TaxID=1685432 RepID=UPI0030ED589D